MILYLELKQVKDELATFKDWKAQEFQTQEFTINRLQGDIQEKDAKLIHLAERLASLEQRDGMAVETIQDYEGKVAEIERLQVENQAYELALNKLREEMNALESER